MARKSNGKCVCTSCSSGYKVSGNNCVCGQLSCCGGCPSGKRKVMNSGKCGCEKAPSPIGGGGGGCNGDVNKCPQCGAYPHYRVCTSSGACGCRTFGGLAKAYHARPNLRTSYRFSGM